MKILNALILSAITIMLTSCMNDSHASITVEYVNESSHTIYIGIGFGSYETIKTLNYGKSHIIHDYYRSEEYPFEDIANASNIYWIQFDNDVKLRLWDYKYFDESIYEVVSKKKGARSLRYAFTDDDYQYALENGTVLEF